MFLFLIVILIIIFASSSLSISINKAIEKYDKIILDEPYVDMIRAIVPDFKGTINISDIASYTVNKKDIFLKIDPQADLKTNIEIILHEISHCLSEEVGHGEEFRAKFEELKNRARAHGYL